MKQAPLIQITLAQGAHSLVHYNGTHAKGLQKRIQVLRIDQLLDRKEWPHGIYIFTTLDGMNAAQKNVACWLWKKLKERPDAFAPLNDPHQFIGRYELLRKLHERGINDFNVHKLCALDAVKFPAFVRYENLHRANLTGLIQTKDELEDEVAKLLLKGEREEDLIVTEWLDYKDDDGLYRKYGAHIAGKRVLAKHLMVAEKWMLKMKHSNRRLVGGDEFEHVKANPHVEMLEPIFEAAGCDWGRVDYSFYKGRLQVWEVNDNPEMGKKWKHDLGRQAAHGVFFPRFESAIEEVSKRLQVGDDVNFSLEASVAIEQQATYIDKPYLE